ncbi:Cell surface glycoprotein 1, related, partial [Eimeria necatrix]
MWFFSNAEAQQTVNEDEPPSSRSSESDAKDDLHKPDEPTPEQSFSPWNFWGQLAAGTQAQLDAESASSMDENEQDGDGQPLHLSSINSQNGHEEDTAPTVPESSDDNQPTSGWSLWGQLTQNTENSTPTHEIPPEGKAATASPNEAVKDTPSKEPSAHDSESASGTFVWNFFGGATSWVSDSKPETPLSEEPVHQSPRTIRQAGEKVDGNENKKDSNSHVVDLPEQAPVIDDELMSGQDPPKHTGTIASVGESSELPFVGKVASNGNNKDSNASKKKTSSQLHSTSGNNAPDSMDEFGEDLTESLPSSKLRIGNEASEKKQETEGDTNFSTVMNEDLNTTGLAGTEPKLMPPVNRGMVHMEPSSILSSETVSHRTQLASNLGDSNFLGDRRPMDEAPMQASESPLAKLLTGRLSKQYTFVERKLPDGTEIIVRNDEIGAPKVKPKLPGGAGLLAPPPTSGTNNLHAAANQKGLSSRSSQGTQEQQQIKESAEETHANKRGASLSLSTIDQPKTSELRNMTKTTENTSSKNAVLSVTGLPEIEDDLFRDHAPQQEPKAEESTPEEAANLGRSSQQRESVSHPTGEEDLQDPTCDSILKMSAEEKTTQTVAIHVPKAPDHIARSEGDSITPQSPVMILTQKGPPLLHIKAHGSTRPRPPLPKAVGVKGLPPVKAKAGEAAGDVEVGEGK